MRFGLLLILMWLAVACSDAADREPRILFLQHDAQQQYQLFLSDMAGKAAEQLTSAEFGVFDYAPAHDGHAIAVGWNHTPSNTEIWLVPLKNGTPQPPEQLLACPNFVCQNPIWAHDNRRIIYERRTASGDRPQLWWLDSQTGETVPVFDSTFVQGYYPQLSPDDSRLSFVLIPDPNDPEAVALPAGHSLDDGHNHTIGSTQQVAIFNFETGERLLIPNLMNSQSRWHPQSDVPEILFTDMQFFGERFGVHLLHANVPENQVADWTEGRMFEDATPNWSPDGVQIAFTRKEANTPMGRQLWLMDSGTREARALTENANLHHGEPHWSRDSSHLLFQRFNTAAANALPGVWVYDLEAESGRQIADGAIRPKWLP